MMPATHSPLRYPGGKSSLSSFIAQVIRLNGVEGGTYVEPYAGGAGAALSLLYQGVVSHIVVNDFDTAIYSFWYSLLNSTARFLDRVQSIPLTIDEWKHQKQIFMNKCDYSVFDVGFATFYLNRCNRSGILMAGPIGGKGQCGQYTLGVRFSRDVLCDKIERISKNKDKISLYNMDAIDLVRNVVPEIGGPKFVYLDPPYYEKGEQLYMNAYEHDDHANLAWALSKVDATVPWMLTYDTSEQIHGMYRDSKTTRYSLNYYAHHAKKGAELLIAPQNVCLPSTVVARYGLG